MRGKYTDAESGLIYMRARYYDPARGSSSIATAL
jgi:RHS repeat-associated protein